jgi:hypothetical protein
MPVFVSPVLVIDGSAAVPALQFITPLTVTLDGVIAPSVTVIAGVVVAVATEPETPFAVTIDKVVTLPSCTAVFANEPTKSFESAEFQPSSPYKSDGEVAAVFDLFIFSVFAIFRTSRNQECY